MYLPVLILCLRMIMFRCRECTSAQCHMLVFAAQLQHDYPWPWQQTRCEAYTMRLFILFYLSASSSTLSTLSYEWQGSSAVVVSYLLWMFRLIISHVVSWSPAASLQEKNTCCLSCVKHKTPRSYLVCEGCRMCLPYYSQTLNRSSSKV